MLTRFLPTRVLLLAALAVLFLGQPAQAQSADAVLARMKAKYDTIETLRASFTQTLSSPYYDGNETFSGSLLLQGDKYRVETDKQTLVTDGAVTWIYSADEDQVLINDAVEDETSFSINQFLFEYPNRYDVSSEGATSYKGQSHVLLTMTPKNNDAFFTNVKLWLRDSDAVVTRLEVTDLNETTMVFDLQDIQLNPALPDGTFTFTPPESAEVIDLRSWALP